MQQVPLSSSGSSNPYKHAASDNGAYVNFPRAVAPCPAPLRLTQSARQQGLEQPLRPGLGQPPCQRTRIHGLVALGAIEALVIEPHGKGPQGEAFTLGAFIGNLLECLPREPRPVAACPGRGWGAWGLGCQVCRWLPGASCRVCHWLPLAWVHCSPWAFR
jgi:hypothetical protein